MGQEAQNLFGILSEVIFTVLHRVILLDKNGGLESLSENQLGEITVCFLNRLAGESCRDKNRY